MQEVEMRRRTRRKETVRQKEAFRRLASNLVFCREDLKTVCVTSLGEGEGKTTVCLEMAKIFASFGKKVLLLDADVSGSDLFRHFYWKKDVIGLDQPFGLTEYLEGRQSLDDVICRTDVEGMYLLFSGKLCQGGDLLSAPMFRDMLQSLRPVFDRILIDTSPLSRSVDAGLMARIADGTLLTVRQGSVKTRMLCDTVQQLERFDARIIGGLLMQVE